MSVVLAKIKKQRTASGFFAVKDSGMVGKEVAVDLSTRKHQQLYNAPSHTWFTCEMVLILQEGEKYGAWFPVELLDLPEDEKTGAAQGGRGDPGVDDKEDPALS